MFFLCLIIRSKQRWLGTNGAFHDLSYNTSTLCLWNSKTVNINILLTLIGKISHDETKTVMLKIKKSGTIQFGGKWFVALLSVMDLRKWDFSKNNYFPNSTSRQGEWRSWKWSSEGEETNKSLILNSKVMSQRAIFRCGVPLKTRSIFTWLFQILPEQGVS